MSILQTIDLKKYYGTERTLYARPRKTGCPHPDVCAYYGSPCRTMRASFPTHGLQVRSPIFAFLPCAMRASRPRVYLKHPVPFSPAPFPESLRSARHPRTAH